MKMYEVLFQWNPTSNNFLFDFLKFFPHFLQDLLQKNGQTVSHDDTLVVHRRRKNPV